MSDHPLKTPRQEAALKALRVAEVHYIQACERAKDARAEEECAEEALGAAEDELEAANAEAEQSSSTTA